jgi:hypothetical protein
MGMALAAEADDRHFLVGNLLKIGIPVIVNLHHDGLPKAKG